MLTARLASSSLRAARPLTGRRWASTMIESLETRWTKLPECEQGAIAEHLAKLQKGDWKKMSLEEKRAAYFIAYGPHGARTPADPMFKWKVMGYTASLVGVSFALFAYWQKTMAKPRNTSTPEWIEAETKLALENKANPFSGAYAKHRKDNHEE